MKYSYLLAIAIVGLITFNLSHASKRIVVEEGVSAFKHGARTAKFGARQFEKRLSPSQLRALQTKIENVKLSKKFKVYARQRATNCLPTIRRYAEEYDLGPLLIAAEEVDETIEKSLSQAKRYYREKTPKSVQRLYSVNHELSDRWLQSSLDFRNAAGELLEDYRGRIKNDLLRPVSNFQTNINDFNKQYLMRKKQ